MLPLYGMITLCQLASGIELDPWLKVGVPQDNTGIVKTAIYIGRLWIRTILYGIHPREFFVHGIGPVRHLNIRASCLSRGITILLSLYIH